MKGTTIFCVVVMLAVSLKETQARSVARSTATQDRAVWRTPGDTRSARVAPAAPTASTLCVQATAAPSSNHCQLHRAACLENRRLRVSHDGACNNAPADPLELKKSVDDMKENRDEKEEKSAKEKKDGSSSRPLVCYQVERDELRQLIVESLYQKSRKEGKSFTLIQKERFELCDKSSDGYLDSDELLTCLERAGANKGNQAHMHRGLCVDALLTEGSHDDNWMLDFHEFSRLFHPHFRPQTRECELEEKKYKDGSETKLDCNWCVCACGDWVCTGGQCADGKQDTAQPDMPVREGRLPAVGEARVQLLNGFVDSSEVEVTSVQRTVAQQYGRERDLQELLNLE